MSQDLLGEILYDGASGEFCRAVEEDGTVYLESPDGSDRFHEFEDPEDFDEVDYTKVPERAKDSPAVFVEQMLDNLQADNISPSGLTLTTYVGLKWARQQTEVVEKD